MKIYTTFKRRYLRTLVFELAELRQFSRLLGYSGQQNLAIRAFSGTAAPFFKQKQSQHRKQNRPTGKFTFFCRTVNIGS